MALTNTSTTTVQPVDDPAPVDSNSSLVSSDAALLLTAVLAGASMTKSARKQYRKMARKAAWQALWWKTKAAFGFKNDVPDTVMGLNFWVFLAIVVGAVIVGTWLFGLTGFLILLGISIIIYLLLQD